MNSNLNFDIRQEQINFRTSGDCTPHIKMGQVGRAVSHKLKQLLRALVEERLPIFEPAVVLVTNITSHWRRNKQNSDKTLLTL